MKFKIKELREAANMTQEELCEKAHISRATLSGLENNIGRNTSSLTLLAVANALGVTINELFLSPAC